MYQNCFTLLKVRGKCFAHLHKMKLTTNKKNISPKCKAIEHFDDFYKSIFNKKWPSIRLGLLSPHKYVAVLNNYSDVDSVKTTLENQGAINIQRLFGIEESKIKDKKRKNSKNKQVFSNTRILEKQLSNISELRQEEELGSLYPADSYTTRTTNETLSDRYIDPSISLSQLHEYVPPSKLIGSDDWIRESEHYSYYSNNSDFPVKILKEDNYVFPSNLHIYTFEPGNISPFESPKRGATDVSDYYLMDGGSILPVLALNLEPDDVVLDMCAAPGGKSYLCLQTLYPKKVVCNDLTESRAHRIRRVMGQFFYDFDKKVERNEIEITQQNGCTLEPSGVFNKILVDVPCTTDRHSVMEDDNNIFKSTRLKERVRIPELQSRLLTNALKLVSVGGTVVYSTCSLSPIQNDGVVHMALKNMSEETDSEIAAVDMTNALEPTKILFRYADIELRYGHLVVPYLVNNFGPTYFCKLVKVK